MRDPKGIIFDLDGVLVNTVDLHFCAWQRMFAELGIPFSRVDMDRFRSIHQRQILAAYVGSLPEAEAIVCLTRKAAYYRELLADARESIAYLPTVAMLYDGVQQGLRIGLASSSINAHHVLEMTGLKPCFDAVADGNTVCRSKPAPDIFVWVAGALGLHPSEIIVVEDGAAGVEGALAAGMYTVGIGVENATPHINLTMSTLKLTTITAQFQENSRAVRHI